MFLIHEALRMKSLWGREDGDMLMVEMWNVKCAEQERGSNMNFPNKYFFCQIHHTFFLPLDSPHSSLAGDESFCDATFCLYHIGWSEARAPLHVFRSSWNLVTRRMRPPRRKLYQDLVSSEAHLKSVWASKCDISPASRLFMLRILSPGCSRPSLGPPTNTCRQ